MRFLLLSIVAPMPMPTTRIVTMTMHNHKSKPSVPVLPLATLVLWIACRVEVHAVAARGMKSDNDIFTPQEETRTRDSRRDLFD